MVRLSLILAVLLMASALFLVTARFQSRQLYMQLDRQEDLARQLDTEWRRLQLERAELARHARIDNVARNELGMISGSPERTLYIRNSGQASAALPSSAAAGGRP